MSALLALIANDPALQAAAIGLVAHLICKVICIVTHKPADGTMFSAVYGVIEFCAGLWLHAKEPAKGKVVFTPPALADPAKVDAELQKSFDKLLAQTGQKPPAPEIKLVD